MRILVTGGTGFIGKPTVTLLSNAGNRLLLITRNKPRAERVLSESRNVELVSGDLSRIDSIRDKLRAFRPEAAVHMAWEGIPDYGWSTSFKNLMEGVNFIKSVSEIGCKKIVALGSCWEYSDPQGQTRESSATEPTGAFSAAKNSLHWIGRAMARELSMSFVWLRLFFVYGPRQKSSSLVPYLIASARANKVPTVTSLAAKNDFVYVDDVASAILKATTSPTGDYALYNVGSGQPTSVGSVVRTVYSTLRQFGNKPAKPHAKERSAIAGESFYADISRIRRALGWAPSVPVIEGIRKIVFDAVGDTPPQKGYQ